MNYIIFDLEWNQCPSGKENENKMLPFEILEIGAVKLNDLWEETDRFQEKIKPMVYHSFHHRTQEVLHMDMNSFQNARSFPQVFQAFLDWCGLESETTFCTWGSQDLLELQRNIRFHHLKNPFPFPLFYIDVQKIFSLQLEDGKSRKSLEYAIDLLDIPKDLEFHEAYSDACYTAEVVKRLDPEQMLSYFSVDYFRIPHDRKSEIQIQYGNYQKFVSKPFQSKPEAMHDRKVSSTRCYLCGRPAKKRIRWFTGNSRNYYCLAYCEEHGWLKGKARLRKTDDGKFYCVKTLKLVAAREAQELVNKKIALKEKLQRPKD